jgi:SAM-dependent methyltransferase
LQEGWAELESEDNVYTYWHRLEILPTSSLEAIRSGASPMAPNPVMERYFKTVDEVWRPAWYQGAPVVDVGSGFGHLTFWLLLSGAGRVHTIGDPTRVAFVMRLAEAGAERGLIPEGAVSPRPEFVVVDDTTLHSAIRPGSVALILLNDTLEHINPKIRPSLFRAAHADLRTGGRIVCRQHNTSSPEVMKRVRALWERAEASEFIPQRAALITAAAPDLSPAVVDTMARGTRGCDAEDLATFVASYRKSGMLPSTSSDAAAVNPETGEPFEGFTGIPEVLREMRDAGLRARAYPEMSSSRRSRWLQGLARRIPAPFFWGHLFDRVSVFQASKGRGPGR